MAMAEEHQNYKKLTGWQPEGKSLLELLTKSASARAVETSSTGSVDAPAFSGRRRIWQLRALITDLTPGHRVGACGYRPIPGRAPAIYRHRETGHHFFGGVRHCGSIWVCPYCAARVGHTRAAELRLGIGHATEDGLSVTLLTFTAQHRVTHALKWLLGAATRTQRRLRGSRRWRTWAAAAGYRGAVRNLEVTWGAGTGWHPHIHALYVTDHPLSIESIATLRALYEAAAAVEGLYAGAAGLTVTRGHAALGDYLTKLGRRRWGPAEEVAGSGLKQGHAGRLLPMQLAEMAGAATDPAERACYTRLWRQYVRAYHGRRQLFWSRGLRRLLRLGTELTDADIVDEQTEAAVEVYVFAPRAWARARDSRRRLVLLEAADREGLEGIQAAVEQYMRGVPRVDDWAPGTVAAWGVTGVRLGT